ncbi:dynein, cytoplasmic 1, intermediate chain 2a isoform X5 [Hypomesus transpacificus]|uniref:dynein, cytoplasmic 1, intermediate chain 2a isoform X5 n=1 Tax=Hypomesus transpacificus TaxID=137520 RepID=UPI001F07C0A6|nr:dynein, cytoplasmic 1, intermediate chain 2a isoform X5 [Hypomesus transpacificus]
MSDKSELKAELERKKQRLAQIREEKKRKEEERKKKEADQKKDAAPHPDDSDLEKKRREADALLQSMGLTDTPAAPLSTSPTSKSVGTPSEAGSQDSGDGTVGPRCSAAKLGMAKVTHVDFPPREMVSYTKETQTPVLTQQKAEEEEEEEESSPPQAALETQSEPPVQEDEEEEAPPHELTEEEKLQILHSEEFMTFFDHSTRIVERALSEHVDMFFDYSGRDLEEKEGEIQAGAKLSLNRQFMDERWSKHRVVTCLDWSPQYPELLVASYNNNEEAPHEPDGVALVWNMKYKKNTPEYVFHCQSAVMSATFAKFHPNMVVGGTYSGQIVLWDNRSNKRTPVQRTPLSAAAHTHPVYCVNVVGTQNAHNLISISTDGKMCSWSLDMLSQPQDSLELTLFKQSKAVAVTSMSFPLGDVNNFVVGSEDGSVYMACRHGSKAGISEMFEGHHGPITGIDCHTAAGPLDFTHLFVTSSFDWTVKLWSTKNNKPLYSFEDNSDYVYDVMWSPVHPALFACVDGVGHLDLWNLNNDTEVPTASVTVEGNPALNRVRWAHSGREIAVGDSDGQILVYDVGEVSRRAGLEHRPLCMAGHNAPSGLEHRPLCMAGHNAPSGLEHRPLCMAGHNAPSGLEHRPLCMAGHNAPSKQTQYIYSVFEMLRRSW